MAGYRKIYTSVMRDKVGDFPVTRMWDVGIQLGNPGKELTCTCVSGVKWCKHKMEAILANADGGFLFQSPDPLNGLFEFEVPMSINGGVIHLVELRMNMTDLVTKGIENTEAELFLTSPPSLRDHPPFHSTAANRRGYFGTIGYGEGRNAVRYLLLAALDSAFLSKEIYPESGGKICRSPRHTLIEQTLWDQIVTENSAEKIWLWKYCLLVNSGVCPPCKEANDKRLADYNKAMTAETVKEIENEWRTSRR